MGPDAVVDRPRVRAQPQVDRHLDEEEAGKEGRWRGLRSGVWDPKLINNGFRFSFV